MHTIRRSLSLRPYATDARQMDLPALHAAYVLMAIIAAGLLNLGVIGMLLCTHLVLDVWKYHVRFRIGLARLPSVLLRANIIDLTLFFLAVCTSVYLNQSLPHIAALAAAGHSHVILMRGIAVLLPKFIIFHHSLRVWLNVKHWKKHRHSMIGKRMTVTEWTCVFALTISLLLLVTAPVILALSGAQFARIMIGMLRFWSF